MVFLSKPIGRKQLSRRNYAKYCEKYDAYFDERDGSWMERKCGDKGCFYCSKRPEKHKIHKYKGVVCR